MHSDLVDASNDQRLPDLLCKGWVTTSQRGVHARPQYPEEETTAEEDQTSTTDKAPAMHQIVGKSLLPCTVFDLVDMVTCIAPREK